MGGTEGQSSRKSDRPPHDERRRHSHQPTTRWRPPWQHPPTCRRIVTEYISIVWTHAAPLQLRSLFDVYMQATRIRMGRGNISTHHGQIKILKHATPNLLTYIQKAVKTGIYRSRDEIDAMNKELQESPTDLRRVRWNVTRGSKIQDYPREYEILSSIPPSPFQPRMPLKDLRKRYNQYVRDFRPTDRLAQQYVHKLRQEQDRGTSPGAAGSSAAATNNYHRPPASADEYYRRLLGGRTAAGAGGARRKLDKASSALNQKSAMLQKAYAVAMKQYQMMRTENLSEKDALEQVEALLAQEDVGEKMSSRARAESLKKEAADDDGAKASVVERGQRAFPNSNPRAREIATKNKALSSDKNDNIDDDDDTPLAMLYGEDQRAFEGMIQWTKRLQAVPYRHWTVGASTALDHWIAKRVLGLSEETWLALLEGDSPELLGRGRDIVMARQALFPETILDAPMEAKEAVKEMDEASEEVEDDLDALLANLAGWTAPDSGEDDVKESSKIAESFVGGTDSASEQELAEELQAWRVQHAEKPYDSWDDEQKQSFMLWLENFIIGVAPESSLALVDLEETRRNLLSVPPQTRESADSFWDKIRDETSAEILLQKLLRDRKEGVDVIIDTNHAFWQLEYRAQLERLVHLGTVGEIANEFVAEVDRARFLTRYGDYLLEGVRMDHLVPDPLGPIRASDLGQTLLDAYDIDPTERFRLEKIQYGHEAASLGGTEAAQRARSLYRAWNTLKAGRANYEEKLFHRGKLGLSYEEEEGEGK